VRTTMFRVADDTGVIHFGMAWLPSSKADAIDWDAVEVHRITVKATFRPAR
jgi:hypothetical protein